MPEDFPILYLFVRNDMPFSMTPGRAAAQMSHATSVFHKRMEDAERAPEVATSHMKRFIQPYADWYHSTPYGYGVVFVKTMSLDEMYGFEHVAETCNFLAEVVIDPEYKFFDGKHVFTSNDVPTGMFAFGMQSTMKRFFGSYEFYKGTAE